jgi:small subunit ribosomal protein S9
MDTDGNAVIAFNNDVVAPWQATTSEGKFDILVKVTGGGPNGQAGAVMLGIARALKRHNPDFDKVLRAGGFLTRDSRMKERKKYGQKGARKRFQFSKR